MGIGKESYLRAAELIGPCARVLLTSHIRPDGDALGGLVAMQAILRDLGKEPVAVALDPVPAKYALLVDREPLVVWPQGQPRPETSTWLAVADPDAVVVLDTCTRSQLEPICSYLDSVHCPKIVVDHHATREALADLYLIDESASATCLLLLEWAEAVGWPIRQTAAEALFVGISTDTGWFRFLNTDGRTLQSAGRLAERGVEPGLMYERLFLRDSVGRVRLLGAMLRTLELHAGGRVAVIAATQRMFRECGAQPAETEDLINEPQRIASVVVTILLVEQEDGRVRVSMRSKGNVNVARIAERFGGGGHERAAGARLSGSIEQIKQRVLEAVCAQLEPLRPQ